MRLVCAFVCLLSLSNSVLAKQETVRIEIRGSTLSNPLEITDAEIVRQFSVWDGPGTRSYDGDGNLYPPAHLDPGKAEGRFIDWPRGKLAELPDNLRYFDVMFYLGRKPNQRRYPFTYASDLQSSRGLVFLPPVSTSIIVHGVEGHWFYASERWEELVTPLIIAASE